MIEFQNPSFASLTDKEWLVTNGLGGYASSTIAGANTRRYHGLFVPSLNPPAERTVVVSKIEETVITSAQIQVTISSNQFSDIIHPEGYQWVKSFERNPLPKITFEGYGFSMEKIIFMIHHSNTSVVRYQNTGKESIRLQLKPLYVWRDYHHLFQEDTQFDFYQESLGADSYTIYPRYQAKPFFVECKGSSFIAQPSWYKNFIYRHETYRGLDDREDAFTNGYFEIELQPQQVGHLVYTMDKDQLGQDWVDVLQKEVARINALKPGLEPHFKLRLTPEAKQFYHDLVIAGDQFLVRRGAGGMTIIAGYHWFTDWGRETMIAMRGLVIAQGHQDLAKQILRTFLSFLKDGLIPNRFPDQGEDPAYNTIDASLWVFIALYEYDQKFHDKAFVQECMPFLQQILNAYRFGTRYHIHMTAEGLIYGGEALSQLTWMDAKVGDEVMTPREGCPVEINALWFNAIQIYVGFLQQAGVDSSEWKSLASTVQTSFRKFFLNQNDYLNDVVIPGELIDDAFRPNQVYAMSLPFSLLTTEESKVLLNQVQEKLVTPLGMRSLSPDHPDFIGIYKGDQWHRDKAYHQGTTWSYLLGEYLLAVLKVNEYSPSAMRQVVKGMEGLQHHFYQEDGIHCINEIFDGENPGAGRGCIQQAWSIGMLLMVFEALKKNTT